MRIEINFSLKRGVNLGLEKSWKIVETLIKKYPCAYWRKRINKRKGKCKYIVEVL